MNSIHTEVRLLNDKISNQDDKIRSLQQKLEQVENHNVRLDKRVQLLENELLQLKNTAKETQRAQMRNLLN